MLWILVHQTVLLKFYKNHNYDDKKKLISVIIYHLHFYKICWLKMDVVFLNLPSKYFFLNIVIYYKIYYLMYLTI